MEISGACAGGILDEKPTNIKVNGTLIDGDTIPPIDPPVDPEIPDPPVDPEIPDLITWASGISYSAGATVTFNGKTYKCIQPHSSLLGWEPVNVPALWQVV